MANSKNILTQEINLKKVEKTKKVVTLQRLQAMLYHVSHSATILESHMTFDKVKVVLPISHASEPIQNKFIKMKFQRQKKTN